MKIDLCKSEWLEVVFAGRNQDYGAYKLRNENSKTTVQAMLIGGLFFIISMSASTIYKHVSGFVPPSRQEIKETVVILDRDLLPDKKVTPPPVPEAPKPKASIKFVPFEAVSAEEVENEEPPAIEVIKLSNPGTETIEGGPGEDLQIVVHEVVVATKLIEDQIIEDGVVQISPEFPGGPQAWAKFMRGYIYPAAARENNISGILLVSFVVEKDGSLTDIQIRRDLNFGTGEEAIRLFKTSPKWSPGVQNGRNVRVAYTQPIKLALD